MNTINETEMLNHKQSWLEYIFNDNIILFAIIINTLTIFIGGFFPNCYAFNIIDTLFTLLFAAEIIVKVNKLGWAEYWKDGWNKFDFIIVILSLPSIIELFTDSSISLNFLLAFRSLRILKSFRLFRFVPNMSGLLKGINLAVKSSFFVCIAFIIFLLIFSIISSVCWGKYAPEYFGNPGLSVYSIFRLFTIEGWYDLPDAIANSGGEIMGVLSRIYFSFLLFVGGIIGMSLINSIFVDAMMSDNNDEVLKQLEEIKKELIELKNKK